MSVWDDMARDAGYRGDEARQVARRIEEEERERSVRRCPGCGEPEDEGDHYDCVVGETRA